MTQTIADRRRYERERKREQRAADRAAGRPTGAAVNAALAEAFAFVVNSGGVNIENGQAMIDSGRVVLLARRILTRRMGFDRALSTAAVLRAISPRAPHGWPSVIADLESPRDRDAA